ncbi:beta-lactamase [Opitutaceae bacterium TAV5]|nr:beta-lactamase [Opitutaceae bacterium TAV5]
MKTGKTKRILRRMIISGFILTGILMFTVVIYVQQPKFGRLPRGERLEKIRKSPHYRDGRFQNLVRTSILTEGVSYFALYREFLFGDKRVRRPANPVPSVKRDLANLDAAQDVLVWFGHSSYFLQTGGKKILVDPVFSGAASPVTFTTRAFTGADAYTVDDLPAIDYLFITHDHWDHLDYETVLKLRPKVGKIVCGLGVGEHLEYWGFERGRIIEMDWGENCAPETGVSVQCLPARHFSGRGFFGNRSLWASFLVRTPTFSFYVGGDSGYGAHFAEIGQKFGPLDLAILENGQYDPSWKSIHMMPEEVWQAARELNAKRLLPVHSAKFSISNHAWNEPLRRITAAAANDADGTAPVLLTPIIGEIVDLRDDAHAFSPWWENVDPKPTPGALALSE